MPKYTNESIERLMKVISRLETPEEAGFQTCH